MNQYDAIREEWNNATLHESVGFTESDIRQFGAELFVEAFALGKSLEYRQQTDDTYGLNKETNLLPKP